MPASSVFAAVVAGLICSIGNARTLVGARRSLRGGTGIGSSIAGPLLNVSLGMVGLLAALWVATNFRGFDSAERWRMAAYRHLAMGNLDACCVSAQRSVQSAPQSVETRIEAGRDSACRSASLVGDEGSQYAHFSSPELLPDRPSAMPAGF